MHKIRIGTRGSILAVRQAQMVEESLQDTIPDLSTDIIKIKTSGDIINNRSLAEIGGKGLFLKEIEQALIDESIDIAVHSMKDIPAFFDDRLLIAGVLKREDPRDAFISHYHNNLQILPLGATVGTCSPRRAAQLRPDLNVKMLRGNVNTRLNKAKNFDAIVLAVCGLERLNMGSKITECISTDIMLPAVGQGMIGLQCHRDNDKMIEMIRTINHLETEIIISAERAFLQKVNGDCTTPLAAFARINAEEIHLQTMLSDGTKNFFAERRGQIDDAQLMGEDAALELLSKKS